nr:hypothetical protein [Tanacetum cinerariifolium]
SKDVQINLVQAVGANLVVTKSSRIELENHNLENPLSISVNETQMQMQESNVDIGNALDADLVVIESSKTEPEKHDSSSRSRNDTHVVDANIKPVNDKELMAKVQLSAEHNVLANGQPHAEQPEFNDEGRVNQDAEKCHVKSPLLNAEFFKMKDMVEKKDLLFEPMFDEYFNPPPSVVSLVHVAAALRPADLTGSPSSTLIDQATPSIKLDELGGVLENKAWLAEMGYRQEEGIDFE